MSMKENEEKLFGIIHNELMEEHKIWLVKARTIEEAIEKFKKTEKERGWDIDDYEFTIETNPYQWEGITITDTEGDFIIWEIKFDEDDISFNDWR